MSLMSLIGKKTLWEKKKKKKLDTFFFNRNVLKNILFLTEDCLVKSKMHTWST